MCEKKKYDCRKRDFGLVRKLAKRFPELIEADVRFFYTRNNGITYYDFEPAGLNRHIDTTLEIFKP